MPAFFVSAHEIATAIDAAGILHHPLTDCGRDWRNGQRRRSNRPGNSQATGPQLGTHSGKRAACSLPEGATGAQPGNLSGQGQRGHALRRRRSFDVSPRTLSVPMTPASPYALRQTPLYERHVTAGGRMVPFAGYSLPVQYPSGIMAEHKWTREHAGLFDVSHMGP